MLSFMFMACSADSGGGSNVFHPIAAQLSLALNGEEYGLREVVVFICVPGQLGILTEDEQSTFAVLPKCSCRKSKSLLEFSYVSSVVDERRAFKQGFDVALTNAANKELQQELAARYTTITKKCGTQAQRFLDDALKALAFTLENEEHARRLVAEYDALESSDELVNKDGAHADAIQFLADDFLWSEGDEFSPHGSDVGMDIWTTYQDEKPRFGKAGIRFLNDLIEQYDVARANDFARLQITLGVAFAELKVHGKLNKDLQATVIAEIDEYDTSADEFINDAVRQELVGRLATMRSYLSRAK